MVRHMQQRNHKKTCTDNKLHHTLSYIYSYITHCIEWWIVNKDTLQMVSPVCLGTERCQWIYASNLYVFIQTIVMFKNFVSPTEGCDCRVSASKDSCFLLCKTDIYYMLFPMQWTWVSLKSFAEQFCFRTTF